MSTTNPTEVISEWDELQIKYGNYPERPKPVTSEAVSNAAVDFAETKDVLVTKTLAELEKLEDEVEEDTLAVYRQQRIEEMRRRRQAYKFGDLYHVSKDEYVTEITDASTASPELYVLIHLYSESKPVCIAINRALAVVARRHGEVKFCKAIGTDVIPKFPECQVPTIIVYKKGTCVQQFLGGTVWGNEKVTPNSMEWVLKQHGILEFSTLDEDPRDDKARSSKPSHDYYVCDAFDDCDQERDASSSEEEERNADRRGYSSIQMEKVLRLK